MRARWLACAGLAACASSTSPDVALEGLAVTALEPKTILTGTALAIEGDSFVDALWGESTLRLSGTVDARDVEVDLPAQFVDYDHMAAAVDAAVIAAFGAADGPVRFDGRAVISTVSAVDGQIYESLPLEVVLDVAPVLTPTIAAIQTGGLVFVNDEVLVTGDGFLLGGDEGQTVATVQGCFQIAGSPECRPVDAQTVPLLPAEPYARDEAYFRFGPAIAGIHAGQFVGEVVIENRHAGGSTLAAAGSAVSYDLIESEIFQVSPSAASLGQYVVFEGGGFVGGDDEAWTEVQMVGTFTPTGEATGTPIDLILIPEFESGNRVRYVMNSDDALASLVDLRTETGTFAGTIRPIIYYRDDQVTGPATAFTLDVAPVKQLVFLDFRPSYVESLRMFGLRAVDQQIRARVVDVVRAAYPAVNIELRLEPPDDFALYSRVEIHGPDPNGMGLFGYDNSPGKDTGNERLYDRLGGVNAVTQQDGFPGYGGVFIESLMAFSFHPAVGDSIPGADVMFDQLFDRFRPDYGDIIVAADLAAGIPPIEGEACPASGRANGMACAVWAMGSLIGGTLAHEIGHSLGLANPGGEGFHNIGDLPNRLMETGGDRPFPERAEVSGNGPSVFCDTEYDYLRQILPSSLPADQTPRPPCS